MCFHIENPGSGLHCPLEEDLGNLDAPPVGVWSPSAAQLACGGPEPSPSPEPSRKTTSSIPRPFPNIASYSLILLLSNFSCTHLLIPTKRCHPLPPKKMQVTVMRLLLLLVGLLLPNVDCQWWGGGYRRPSNPFRHSHRQVG